VGLFQGFQGRRGHNAITHHIARTKVDLVGRERFEPGHSELPSHWRHLGPPLFA